MYVALSYIKIFSDSPGVQSCKKYIQITLLYFSAVPKSVPVAARFQSSLWQVRDENREENEKKETTYTAFWEIPWGIFFCDYLNVWILGLSAFIWSPAQWKSAWTDAGKLTEHFDTKYGWIEDDCKKKLPPKVRSAWMRGTCGRIFVEIYRQLQ